MKGLALAVGLALLAVGCQRSETSAENTFGGPGAMPPNPNGMAKPEDKPDKPDKLGLTATEKPEKPVKPDKLDLAGTKLGGVSIKGANVAGGAGPFSNTGLNGSQGASPGGMPPKP